MKLITNDIQTHAKMLATMFFSSVGIHPDYWFDEKYVASRIKDKKLVWAYRDAIDALCTNWIAKRAKTFIFSSSEVLNFPIHTAVEPGHYVAPFPEMIFQFTKPLAESVLGLTGAMPGGREIKDDHVSALVIGWPSDKAEGKFYASEDLINITAYYQSSSFNRAVLYVDGKGEVAYERALGGYIPGGKEDKQIIVNLALWCIAYLNSPRIAIEKVARASPSVNAKREKSGKNKIEEHYILKVVPERPKYTYKGQPALRIGSKHSYKYDVMSHPRRLPSGKVIIIPAHQRGIENEKYVPKVRVVG